MASAKKKAMKLMAREQAKRDKKYNPSPKPEQKSTNKILGLGSIADRNKKGVVQNYTANLKVAWYFEQWYEKLILVVFCAMGLWRIVMFF